MRRALALGLGLWTGAMVQPAAAAKFFVGPIVGADCTHDSLDGALAEAAAIPGTDQILISANQPTRDAPLVIGWQNVVLRGVTSCRDETPWVRELSFTSSEGVVALGDPHSINGVTLDSLVIAIQRDAGRGLRIENRSIVQLRDVTIRGGAAARGAGIAMHGPHAVLLIGGASQVIGGEATEHGAGIYCEGGGLLSIGRDVVIRENYALGDGGGVYLDGCELTSRAGGPTAGIRNNRADGSGGGLYAGGGASVTLRGDEDLPASVAGNRAFGSGGGLALDGAGTTAHAVNARIDGNFADLLGAGVLVSDRADFEMEREGATCHDVLRCSSLSDNAIFETTAPGGDGGGIAVLGGATAALRQTYVAGNRAAALESGGAAFVYGLGSRLDVEGSMFHRNRGEDIFAVDFGAHLVFAFSSTASNLLFRGTFFAGGFGAIIEVYSSVFGEDEGELLSLAIGISPGDCVIRSRADAALGDWGMFQVVASPESLFRDVAAGDLHLRAGAPAIDFCDTHFYTPVDLDFDDDPRGVDQAGVRDSLGPYDAGADEYVPEAGARLGALAALAALAVMARLRPR